MIKGMTKEEKFEKYEALTRELLDPATNENMAREDAVLEELDDIWYSLSDEETVELRARMKIGRSKCRTA